MATLAAVPVVKEAQIADAIASIPPPEGVRLRRFFFDTDWSGDPCLRVVFSHSKRYDLTPRRVRQIAEFAHAVRAALWALDLVEIPYTRFEDVR